MDRHYLIFHSGLRLFKNASTPSLASSVIYYPANISFEYCTGLPSASLLPGDIWLIGICWHHIKIANNLGRIGITINCLKRNLVSRKAYGIPASRGCAFKSLLKLSEKYLRMGNWEAGELFRTIARIIPGNYCR